MSESEHVQTCFLALPFVDHEHVIEFMRSSTCAERFKINIDEKLIHICLFSKINISITGDLRFYVSYLTTSRFWIVSLFKISLLKKNDVNLRSRLSLIDRYLIFVFQYDRR